MYMHASVNHCLHQGKPVGSASSVKIKDYGELAASEFVPGSEVHIYSVFSRNNPPAAGPFPLFDSLIGTGTSTSSLMPYTTKIAKMN